MYQSFHLQNVGAFREMSWQGLGHINVLIGENDTGKSYLLKLLYSLTRAVDEYRKTQKGEPKLWSEVLSEKLRWVFQPPNFELGRLVKKGEDKLRVRANLSGRELSFSFGRSTTKEIRNVSDTSLPETSGALFFPPKEVLTGLDAIAASREQLKMAGFGDTYLDLIHALRIGTTRGRYRHPLGEVKESLEELFSGALEYEDGEFVFKRGNERYGMSQLAEGIKKIGILTHLIRNRTVNEGSILFFDEPEANLHPRASVRLVDMLQLLSTAGVQVFVATHDYFILKRLEQLARREDARIAICSLRREDGEIEAELSDLREGMPDNPIIDVSLDLLEDEFAFGAREA
jgi:AAA15 family ATPase/GTPase